MVLQEAIKKLRGICTRNIARCEFEQRNLIHVNVLLNELKTKKVPDGSTNVEIALHSRLKRIKAIFGNL